MMSTQFAPSQRPSPFANKINIVNSNYNHYGQSVLRPYSRSAQSTAHSSTELSRSGSTHSSLSFSAHRSGSAYKKARLDIDSTSVFKQSLLHDDADVDFSAGEVDDEVVALTNSSVGDSRSKAKYFNYRSLINQDSKVKRFFTKLDSDTFSLFSSTSKAHAPLATVNSLPLEVLRLVVSYADDHRTQVACLYVNKLFYSAAKFVVYEVPQLTSSYRVAQLISSLKENHQNGGYIKRLDLSRLESGVITREVDDEDIAQDDEGTHMGPEVMEYALATWRDWKFRDDPLYGSSILNSYTLSKTKSNMSTDSAVSITSSLQRILSKWKVDSREMHVNVKDSVKKRLGKLKKKFQFQTKMKVSKVHAQLTRKPSLAESQPPATKRSGKSVNFSTQRDPKNQPFATAHPYTNKFLMKYAGMKDLPIGYIFYFIDLCPNLQHVDLSQLTLSSDFAIVYENEQQPRLPSLIESVLGKDASEASTDVAHYLSDANVYFKMDSYQREFIKLYELDILVRLAQLEKLERVVLHSLTWLNYRNIHKFVHGSRAVENGALREIDFTNSGMIRGLKWAKRFEVDALKEYFKNEVEPVEDDVEHPNDVLLRTIGMNY